MTTALVLSGNSFIGGHLCRTLRASGANVVATGWGPGVTAGMELCDLTDRERVRQVVAAARPRWVFNCAGATSGNDPWLAYRLHVEGTLNVLSAVAGQAPSAPVVLLGSSAEYGPVAPEALPVTEDQPAVPLSFFGASKLAQTQAARAAAAEWKLSVLVARPFNVIGPGLPGHYFAAALAERLLRAKAAGESGEVPVVNAGATRDFVDVRDLAAALLGLAERAAPPAGETAVYNVASGHETPLRAVADRLCALAGGFRAVDAGAGQSRSGIARSCGDAARLRRAIGWSPRVGWEQSIADMWHSLVGPPPAVPARR